ncbi:YwhD family protein, partial [Staphylococcus saccharolyticus]
FIINQIGDDNKKILKDFLQNHNLEMWNNSSETLYQAFE